MRPAHAHRPLARLRDPGRRAAGDGAGAGLGAIAITDHNEISGALEARELAEEIGGIKVIVAEEVKTAEQGEVIGLFLEEKIARGMTMAETIAEISRQGGLVYVPHPFDRLHSVPDYEHLLDIVEEIDILEVFNPRVALDRLQRGGRAVRRQVPDRPRRGLRQPRRPGPGQRHDPAARLRRAGGVPRVDAGRRHRPQAQEPGLRAGAEVPADERRPWRRGRAHGGQGLMQAGAPAGARSALVKEVERPEEAAGGRAVPTTDDEIREKYLERAIRELNELARDLQACEHCPRGNLMPVLGSGHPQADIMMLKHAATAAEIEEGVAFYGRAGQRADEELQAARDRPARGLRHALRQVPAADPDARRRPSASRGSPRRSRSCSRGCVVVMGERGARDPERPGAAAGATRSSRLEGEIQRLTPTIDALFVPDIDDSLDERGAPSALLGAFRALGDWYDELPPVLGNPQLRRRHAGSWGSSATTNSRRCG